MIFEHNFSPILFEFGNSEIRWYGLLFTIGIISAYLITYYIFKKQKYPTTILESLAVYLFFGMLIGARLGHIFFYNTQYYLSNPVDILKIWEGGLASHGGAIGVFLAYLIWIKIYKIKFTKYADALVISFPFLAGFVRIGNWFNSEILGKATSGDFGVIFTRLGEDFPRHPVQLYSALMNFLIFIILFILYKKYYKKAKPLFFLFLYMFLYFSGRFIIEFWKDLHGPIESISLSMGQLLSIPAVLISILYFLFYFKKRAF